MTSKRVFADTNLFLRYLTNDVPKQADAVEDLLKRAINDEITLVANNMVIAEIVWTLESFYKLPKTAIRTKILAILNTPGLDIVDSDLVLQGITWYAEKNVDFIDAYNAAWLLEQSLDTVYTFDRKHSARLAVTVRVPEKNELPDEDGSTGQA